MELVTKGKSYNAIFVVVHCFVRTSVENVPSVLRILPKSCSILIFPALFR